MCEGRCEPASVADSEWRTPRRPCRRDPDVGSSEEASTAITSEECTRTRLRVCRHSSFDPRTRAACCSARIRWVASAPAWRFSSATASIADGDAASPAPAGSDDEGLPAPMGSRSSSTAITLLREALGEGRPIAGIGSSVTSLRNAATRALVQCVSGWEIGVRLVGDCIAHVGAGAAARPDAVTLDRSGELRRE